MGARQLTLDIIMVGFELCLNSNFLFNRILIDNFCLFLAHINTAEGWHIFDDINVKKQKYLNLTNEEVVSNAGNSSTQINLCDN